jgi:hypothetical protein
MGRQFFLDGRFKADGGIGFVHPFCASRAQPDSTEERLEALVVAGVWSLRDFACVLQFVSEDSDELLVASFRADDNAEVPVLSAGGNMMQQISVELEPLRYDAGFDVNDDVRFVEGLDEATKGRRARQTLGNQGPHSGFGGANVSARWITPGECQSEYEDQGVHQPADLRCVEPGWMVG